MDLGSGLADLRLFDTGGQEVGYLLVTPPPSQPTWIDAVATLPVPVVETEKVRSSGFEVDLGTAQLIDRVRFEGIAAPFLKRVHVEGSGDRSRWTVLVDEGTLFELPENDLQQLELDVAAGSHRYLRVVWDDTQSARLSQTPRFSARRVAAAVPRAPLTTPLVFERRPSEPGRSRFRVKLPGVRLPITTLILDVPGAPVLREVDVYESRVNGLQAEPTRIGRGTIKRVEQGGVVAASDRVSIEAPREAELDLVVDDGNNPPLELRGVTAEFAALPWIYFEARTGALVARYGDAAMTAPRYDLEAARSSVRIETVADAAWGEPRAREPRDNEPAVAPELPIEGSAVDVTAFRFTREIAPGDAGLIALRLDAAALAHSRGFAPRFHDLRIVDEQNRQVPYLVERVSEPLSIDIPLTVATARPEELGRAYQAESVYRFELPYAELPTPQLVLRTSARVFRRRVAVLVGRPADRQHRNPWADTLRESEWAHAEQDTAAPDLVLTLPTGDRRDLLLVIQDGDNTSLSITGSRVLLNAYRLRVFRRQGQALRLMYGNPDLLPPTYDLTMLTSRVMGTSALEVTPGPESDRRPGDPGDPTSPVSARVFWAILGVAVTVLLGLIARLMKGPGGERRTESGKLKAES